MGEESVTSSGTAAKKPGFWSFFGPGLITGAADDDPSGIATYAQVGAKFGYDLGWTMLLCYPLMSAVQEISGRLGRVSGHGIAGNIRKHYSPTFVTIMVGLLLVANIINIGADIGAMADAVHLLIAGPTSLYVVLLGVTCAALEVFMKYDRYAAVLKWLCISLFAYVATVLVVQVPWGEAAYHLVVPEFRFDADLIVSIVAVLGTTISPYLFFWQSSEEAEVERQKGEQPLTREPDKAKPELHRIRLDTYVGMGFSNIISLCIIYTAAATLHAHGVTDIQSSAQAAEALRPITGPFAFFVFAAGIIGTGLLAVPVLAGSAAYAVGEAMRWPTGLGRLPHQAKAFYGVVTVATLVGMGLNFTPIDPIKALFWAAVVNGVVSVPVLAVMMRLATRRDVMGQFVLPPILAGMGWLTTAVMAFTVVAMLLTWGH